MAQRVVYYPVFDDPAALAEHFYRALFYLQPYHAQIEKVVLYTRAPVSELSISPYLDSSISRLDPSMGGRLEIVPLAGSAQPSLADADLVLLWDRRRESELSLPPGKPHACVDIGAVGEGDTYIEIGAHLAPVTPGMVARDGERLAAALAAARTSKAYVFGTGPGLSAIGDRDVSNGVSIVCNSIVRNRPLLERIRPKFIVAADPIFHAGCSRYAQEFRAHLVEALDRHPAWLVIQGRDAALYRALLPERVHDRILPIPVRYSVRPNLTLPVPFQVTGTRNVFTMFLFPLAAALADEICVLGCDGRPVSEGHHFWRHDQASQFNDAMDDIRRAHPGFFTLDYGEYYALHCETVRRWIRAAEARGKRVVNLTQSYIPALAARAGGGLAPVEVPASFQLTMRMTYWVRMAQVTYGNSLAAAASRPWLHRLLRLPVRALRAVMGGMHLRASR